LESTLQDIEDGSEIDNLGELSGVDLDQVDVVLTHSLLGLDKRLGLALDLDEEAGGARRDADLSRPAGVCLLLPLVSNSGLTTSLDGVSTAGLEPGVALQFDLHITRVERSGDEELVLGVAFNGVLSGPLVSVGDFVLVSPLVAVLPEVLDASLGLLHLLPCALPVLASGVLGPGGQVELPVTITSTSKVGNDGGQCVDVRELLENGFLEEHFAREADSAEGTLALARDNPSGRPGRWREVGDSTSTAHSQEENDRAVVDLAAASAGLAGDGVFGDDVVHDGGETERRSAAILDGEDGDGVEDVVAVAREGVEVLLAVEFDDLELLESLALVTIEEAFVVGQVRDEFGS
jgi:hypothetical protein